MGGNQTEIVSNNWRFNRKYRFRNRLLLAVLSLRKLSRAAMHALLCGKNAIVLDYVDIF